MLHIIGGSYEEKCYFPEWNQLFGSGLRATIALSELSKKNTLYTPASKEKRKLMNQYSQQYNFNLFTFLNNSNYTFTYLHPLSRPYLYSSNTKNMVSKTSFKVDGEMVLYFGLLEGTPLINAKKLVYDPQSPFEAKLYKEGKFDSITYVLNKDEAKLLTRQNDVVKMGNILLNIKKIDCVVIKCGSLGSYVFKKNRHYLISPYETKKVWLIGSGDIYSSVFAHYYLIKRLDPVESATLASKYTAFYSQTRIIPLSKNTSDSAFDFLPKKILMNSSPKQKKIYLAGPFFNIHQIWLVNEVRDILIRKGLKVFSPMHDIGIGSAKKVAPADLRAIKNSKFVFALLDDLDTGTVFEIGYARALGIPVIGYSSIKSQNDFTMLIGSDCEIYNDLSTAIYKLIWQLMKQ